MNTTKMKPNGSLLLTASFKQVVETVFFPLKNVFALNECVYTTATVQACLEYKKLWVHLQLTYLTSTHMKCR